MQLEVIGKLRPMNDAEQSYYGDDDIPIFSKKQAADQTQCEYTYFNQDYGQPSHSSHNHGQPSDWSRDVSFSFKVIILLCFNFFLYNSNFLFFNILTKIYFEQFHIVF